MENIRRDMHTKADQHRAMNEAIRRSGAGSPY